MAQPAPEVRTPRLSLRAFRPDDIDLIERLNSDPEVMRHMGGPMARSESEAMLADRILGYAERHPGLGIWATMEIASGVCIGMHVLNHMHGEAHVQVGYRLFPAFWGRGYATEMSIALLHYGFARLILPTIVAITDPQNAGSQRVLEKCALKRGGLRSFQHPAYASCGPQVWFERDAQAWLTDMAAGGML